MDEMKITLTVEQARKMRNDLADVYMNVVHLLARHDVHERLEAFRTAMTKIDDVYAELHSAILEGE